MTELGEASSPWLTADEREVYFHRLVTGQNFNLFSAIRSGPGVPFPPPTPLSTVNTSDADYAPSLSADGLTLYFVRSGYSAAFARRTSLTAPFPIGGPLSLGPAPTMQVAQPRWATGGIYYIGWRTGTRLTLYADVSPTWAQSLVLSTSGDIASFSLSSDERVLYFSQTPPSGLTRTVHRAGRTSASQPFSNPAPVAELNNTAAIYGVGVTWVSDDECVLYADATMSSGGPRVVVRATRP